MKVLVKSTYVEGQQLGQREQRSARLISSASLRLILVLGKVGVWNSISFLLLPVEGMQDIRIDV
jgi:hypothetical protein